ncbi:MAG: TonB-dependent receptor [Myxococcota bacterium]|nr:TonB-dependent receptor [Myxococcota bacterium]
MKLRNEPGGGSVFLRRTFFLLVCVCLMVVGYSDILGAQELDSLEDPEDIEQIVEDPDVGNAAQIGVDAEGEPLDDTPDAIDPDEFDPALGDAMDPPRPGDVEEITVTATKRSQNIQDVPISITAIGAQTILDAGITRFTELQQFVPNLQIRPVTDTRSTSIRIRGIGSVGNNAGIDPSVGVFIDGVYQGRAGMSVSDLLDIERVEVLRGPQGTLFGKNTAAGAINVVTKRPGNEFETFLEGRIGNYDDMQFRGSMNIPILEDELALRLSGYKVQREGFAVNRFDGERVNDANQYGVRGRLAWDVTENLSFELIGDYNHQNTRSFVAEISDWGLGESVSGVDFGRLAFAQDPPALLPVADPYDRVVGANVTPQNVVDVAGLSLDTTLLLGDYDLRWLSAWRTYSTNSRFDGDFSEYDAVQADQNVSLNQATSELMLTSPQWNRFEYQAGLYMFYMSMDTEDRNGFESGLAEVPAPNPFSLFGATTNVNQNTHQTLSLAAYGEGTLSILDQLEFTGGLRVTYEKKWRKGQSQCVSLNQFCELFDIGGLFGPTITLDQELDVTDVTGRAILRYRPTDSLMLYASFANGFKSGGFNQLRVPANAESEFGDEKAYSYEAGLRSQWFDNQLTFNITGFFTDYDDFQAQTFDGSTILVRNAGQLFSYGFESDMVYSPSWIDNLQLGLQLGFNIAKYQSFPDAQATVPEQVAEAFPAAPLVYCQQTPCTQDLSGQVLDNAPRWTSTLFLNYERPVPKVPIFWFGRIDYTYTSEYYLAQDLDPNLLQSGYNLLNLHTGFRTDDDLLEFTLWMTNVTDSNYFVIGFDVPVISGYAGVLGPPRQYGGTVRVRF